MGVVDLAQFPWRLYGWRPHSWLLGKTHETESTLQPDLGPYVAHVPGSVHRALLEAGVIPDWHEGVNSRASEWLEHRHWQFTTTVPAGTFSDGEQLVIDAQGLDHAGWLFVNGREAGTFNGALLPHRFDITQFVYAAKETKLDIFFDEAPREQHQIGYTSRSQHFKPRYNYGWDWIPRIVTTGIWNTLTLRSGLDASLEIVGAHADLADDNRTGRVALTVSCGSEPEWEKVERFEVTLRDGVSVLGSSFGHATFPDTSLELRGLQVEPWWPNGMGPAKLYDLEIRALNDEGHELWLRTLRVGFKRIEWRACEGAPEGALPWICVVNGQPVFLQGANWSPIRSAFPDTTPAEYAHRVDLYREMGCTCLRVWGGGLLERTEFLDACDRAGILVWQDFPLSSSGLENVPPCEAGAVERLSRIAEAYVSRHAYHACRLLWCGGNELFEERDGLQIPMTTDHLCIAALKEVVDRWDPGRRFIPATPCGPIFYASLENFGKGIHHLVHGPWGMGPFGSLDAWKEYWTRDDSLFRAEVGMPGAEPERLIRRYAGNMPVWPPTGEYWKHSSAWWIDWTRHCERCSDPDERIALAQYVEHTQREQAEALAFAASACKGRFPACGGVIVWHGHDCFPCPINNSLIDFEGNPKPAYYALREVYRS